MRKMVLLTLLFTMMVNSGYLFPTKVFACSCMELSIEEKVDIASTIFKGTLVSKDTQGENQFRIDKVWKGDPAEGYVFSGIFGMCGTEFEEGNDYLVYTSTSKGVESTSICSGNKLIADAGEDIQALDRLFDPSSKMRYTPFLLFTFVVAGAVLWMVIYKRKKT